MTRSKTLPRDRARAAFGYALALALASGGGLPVGAAAFGIVPPVLELTGVLSLPGGVPDEVMRVQSSPGGVGGQSGGQSGGQQSQSGGQTGRSFTPGDGADPAGQGRFVFLNSRDTDRLIYVILSARRTCGDDWIEPRYRIDCLRFHFWQMSRELPKSGEYEPVRRALAKAAGDLDRIVRRNLDRSAPAVRPRIEGKPLAPRLPPIRAVKPEAEAQAARAAVAVVEEAGTVLLRSSENSERRQVHYRSIAGAIDSTKVLLRSA
ncbi:hypothetical protein DEA8626_02225 [Defluviimonas aquaemixtae]|uniref:Uncharacterized protein n=1 Tax=Albidovulum aquaemixtae TaxID=1542388 RepID=A0A2R8B864_9RHOB|nr:hypothetical protein [Defluviimonas aquaemixtae]SPH18683.1 hypothetical protein DEA8626_02225 [Defluviimonas aquaemixtae]